MAEIAPKPVKGCDKRLWWFLHTLDHATRIPGNPPDKSGLEYPSSQWLSAFREDRGLDTDTFNTAHKLGLIEVKPNTFSEAGWVKLTAQGLEFIRLHTKLPYDHDLVIQVP